MLGESRGGETPFAGSLGVPPVPMAIGTRAGGQKVRSADDVNKAE